MLRTWFTESIICDPLISPSGMDRGHLTDEEAQEGALPNTIPASEQEIQDLVLGFPFSSIHVLIKHNIQRVWMVREPKPLWARDSKVEGEMGLEDHENPECQGQDQGVDFIPQEKESLKQGTG